MTDQTQKVNAELMTFPELMESLKNPPPVPADIERRVANMFPQAEMPGGFKVYVPHQPFDNFFEGFDP